MDLGRVVLTGGELLVIVSLAALLGTVAILRYERYVERHGHRGGSAMGDALGNIIDVYDPGQARAARDLQGQRNVGPIARIPDQDDDDPIRLTFGPDGSPRAVRIRRPR